MSFFGDALKTIESVVLLRSKVERLDQELERTNGEAARDGLAFHHRYVVRG